MDKNNPNTIALAALSMLDVSNRKRTKIVSEFAQPSEMLSNPKKCESAFSKHADKAAYCAFCDNVKEFGKTAARLEKENVGLVTLLDEEYPDRLRTVDDAPLVLYLKGNASLLNSRSIAVVGTRRPTRYGQKIAEDFTRAFARAKLTVVSGFARGVDSVAHRVCVEEDCPTVAVFGCGLNVCYPAENRELMASVLARGGLFVSEYALDVRPLAYHFPDRNRIISGLSDGVFLAEAAENSGSLITVNLALEQGREVFAVPANINSPASGGSNKVLRSMQGALVLTPEDVLSGLGISTEKNETVGDAVQLNLTEQIIVDALYEGDLHFEELLEKTECSANELSSTLMNLELIGVVEKLAGNFYQLCK